MTIREIGQGSSDISLQVRIVEELWVLKRKNKTPSLEHRLPMRLSTRLPM